MGKQSGAAKRKQREKALQGVSVRVPRRGTEPKTVRAFLGPTNSGKTYQALQRLIQTGHGVYAAPLRMLAREAYDKLAKQLGEEQVGLRTGEEKINPGASIICATTEMAPMDGRLLVLDETHWAADANRGSAWTRLLLGAQYQEMILLGSADVLPLLQSCFDQSLQLEVFERLGPLEWDEPTSISQMQAGDALVAYSRKTVLHLASLVAEEHGLDRLAVLYGSMPLASRLEQLDRVREGQADLVVCTDVIGHGLNLPLRRMIFAETQKWDGVSRRDLLPWEAAQVAGRAGRYGKHAGGLVTILSGEAWYTPKSSVVRAGLKPKKLVHQNPDLYAFQPVYRGRLRPRLEDLGGVESERLAQALAYWYRQARRELAQYPWVEIEDDELISARLAVACDALGSRINQVSPEWLWDLAQSPIDADQPGGIQLLSNMARRLVGRGSLEQWTSLNPEKMDLEKAEQSAAQVAALLWYANRFGKSTGLDVEAVSKLEEAIASRVSQLLPKAIQQGRGHCRQCGRQCAPWHDLCYGCAQGY